jgi:MFS transporter, YNFM family, putative membrane transport protein
MKQRDHFNLQLLVFTLVMAAFTNLYITQPVLPVLQREFGADASAASLTISAVILGIALANLPFGMLADTYPIRTIILIGGFVVSIFGFFCAVTTSLELLIVARFIQGLFIPALTTCLAAYLSRNLPLERLNIVMGSYVSATVAGGLGGRLLGGWIHPPLHWRYAFVSASVFLLVTTIAASRLLPADSKPAEKDQHPLGFVELINRKDLLLIYFVAFSAFFVFSSVFNFLPFYLSGPPFHARTEIITLMYLSYIIGIAIGPFAGSLSNRIGGGTTMALGAALFGLAIVITLIKSLVVIALCLTGICAGFFSIHAAAVGSLNRQVTSSQGRANSLYVLFYYLGGAIGITSSGYVYIAMGWIGVVILGCIVLLVPFITGVREKV